MGLIPTRVTRGAKNCLELESAIFSPEEVTPEEVTPSSIDNANGSETSLGDSDRFAVENNDISLEANNFQIR
ncbi:MAG: hypothetical protein SWX82_22305 [Cyanobacteriota bacterium]|nr:hypothetical protein [Cyanobacteriota bacterium]